MPVRIKDNLTAKVKAFWDGLEDDLKLVGEIGSEEIVRSTLAGIGANDQPFKPYSQSYKELIEAVGGKASGVVDLRGIFYHKGKTPRQFHFKDKERELRRQRNAFRVGGGRRSFVSVKIAGKQITFRTGLTRPRLGLTDPVSEMSLDLIKVVTSKTGFKLIYEPRKEKYMIFHQDTRPWFSVNKTPVQAAIREALKQVFKARVANFNAGNSG